jgi:hypothetical protein
MVNRNFILTAFSACSWACLHQTVIVAHVSFYSGEFLTRHRVDIIATWKYTLLMFLRGLLYDQTAVKRGYALGQKQMFVCF